jgi:parallel beta-helix repeat protein
MGSTDYGNQLIQFEFGDPLNAAEFNRRDANITDTGVYDGGLLSIVNDTTVNLATTTIEIGDGTYSVRINTTSVVAVTVSTSNIYVVARWSYSAQVNWYADILAVDYASLQANDVIFGKCVYTGSTLTSIDYNQKTLPRIVSVGNIEAMLKPSAVNGQMYIAVASGKFSYGTAQKSFAGGNSPTITAPTTNPRIDLIYIDSSGVLQALTGVEAVSPSPPNHSPYLPISEISLSVGDTQIDSEAITDVRPWLNLGDTLTTAILAEHSSTGAHKWIDVTNSDYGATGDGVTDDTAAIQAAIDVAAAGTVKAVYFPAGTYLVSTSLLLSTSSYDGIVLFGNGRSSQIYTTTDVTNYKVIEFNTVDRCEIRDLYILGDAVPTNTRTSIYFEDCTNCIITKCFIEKHYYGIWLEGSTNNLINNNDIYDVENWFATISGGSHFNRISTNVCKATNAIGMGTWDNSHDNIFIGNEIQSVGSVSEGNCFHIREGDRTKVIGNILHDSVSEMITVRSSDDVVISNNMLSNVGQTGIFVFLDSARTQIIGNTIRDPKIGSTSSAIKVDDDDAQPGAAHYGVIQNNKIYGSLGHGIVVRECNNWLVSGNYIDGTATVGIYIFNGANNCSVVGNYVTGTVQDGISVNMNCNNFMVTDNFVTDADQDDNGGFYGISVLSNCRYGKISNNKVFVSHTIGIADATEANKLHDADGGFDSDMVGAVVWNTTDNVKANITAFVDSGELTLDADIFVSGEDYVIASEHFQTKNIYIASGCTDIMVNSNDCFPARDFDADAIDIDGENCLVEGNKRNIFWEFGDTIPSAAELTLGVGKIFNISGTTNITSIAAISSVPGRVVTLRFAGVLTFTDGSNLKLAGNFVTTGDDTITLVCDGTDWYEISRSVN